MQTRYAMPADAKSTSGVVTGSANDGGPVGIDQIFEAQAISAPDALALAFESERVSYRELQAHADRLALRLRVAGLGRDALAGLCVERSPEMIVALLAVLKAGGAYLPLDPTYPAERLAFMLGDARPAVLVTTRALRKLLPEFDGRVVLLDDPLEAGGPLPRATRRVGDLAYVIYTSGSTGRPKGVMIEHRGLLNLARAQAMIIAPTPADRILQFASLSFDASIFEIVMALASGASLHLAPRPALLPGVPLTRLLRKRGITQVTLPPSVLATLSPDDLPDLRTVIVAGEACPQALAERWSRGRRFFNAYGPTEATVWATTAAFQNGETISIGTPIPNAQIHLLDESLRPVTNGDAGELHIAGAGVARGYLRRESLTAERFIRDPVSNARLYRTGDLGRRRSDGTIEFLGRIDEQVKIRGFRIEPGEIEAAIARHPKVQQSVVVTREFDVNDKRLIAFVVPREAPGPGQRELRDFLRLSLPDHLIPATIEIIDAIPLLPNGKVDRAALHQTPVATASDSAPPRDQLEKTLATAWCRILRIDYIGIDDDFFDCGGDSLLAAQLLTQLSSALDLDLSLREFFDAPTISAFAGHIGVARTAKRRVEAPPIVHVSRDEPLRLSSAQERLWFLHQLDPTSTAYHLGIELVLDGPLDVARLESSLNALVARHEILRTIYPDDRGRPGQVILSATLLEVASVDLANAPDREVAAREQAQAEMRRPFDLATGPLFRATLLRLGANAHQLIVVMHHIVSDGWSHGIFLRELSALYTGQTLPALPFQYSDFATWQQAQDGHPRSLEYWRRQLARPLPELDLPTLISADAAPSRHAAAHQFVIASDLADALRQLGRREGTTLFMTLLAGFNALLARCSGEEEIVIGAPIANRTHSGLEKLIGFFVNTVVLRSDLSANPDFREVLRRTRRTALDAFEHQTLPFEQLVNVLAPERQLHRQPLFRVMFALQNAPIDPPSLPGLAVTTRELTSDTAIFDLAVQVEETPNGLSGTIQYDTGLFSAAAIRTLAEDFSATLAAVAADPALTLGALPVTLANEAAGDDDNLAAIEATMLSDSAVADAAVLARTTLESERRLVAYLVLSQPDALKSIRTRIEPRLPEAARPDDWVSLSSIPRTATGRVDRKALAAIPVVDSDLAQRATEQFRKTAGISDAIVLVSDERPRQPRLHLSNLLPDWRRRAPAQAQPVETCAESPQPACEATAISHGAALRVASKAPATLVESLECAAERSTGGLMFLDSVTSAELRPYAKLLDEARRILTGLRDAGLRPQDKVVFQFDQNADFLAAFWGCVLGGFVPVPVSFAAGQTAATKKLQQVCGALPNAVVLTVERIAGSLPPLGATRVLTLDSLRHQEPAIDVFHAKSDDIALLMLTSGSTSAPKLVQLTHGNLLSRSAASIQMHGFTSHEVTFNWMPLDHVAGLVYFHLRDVMLGCRQIHAPTSAVLESPLRWIDWLADHRATITFAPNFAFALINERADEIATRRWDLSSLHFVLNGAEAIIAGTARRFVELLAPHGLATSAMRPAWGMAETSSGVTYAERLVETIPGFVEVGAPVPGFSIRIVDAENELLREGEVGRLQVRGPTVTPGYLNALEANREAFTSDGWFDTGDLGVLREGRLTITGRAREVIIVNGINYHSPEIEAVVESVPGVRPSLAAAFAIRENGADTDQLGIVFCPIDSAGALRLAGEIRERVAGEIGVTPAWILPVEPDEIPKTAIGKIQRAQLRERFKRGGFETALTQLDKMAANANTLPAWFHRRVWRRRAPHPPSLIRSHGVTLVFCDRHGLGAALCAQLGSACITVEIGEQFASREDAARRFTVRPAHLEDYQRVIETVLQSTLGIERIIHLWTCDQTEEADVEGALDNGFFSILALAQALARPERGQPVQLLVASIRAQATGEEEAIDLGKAPLLGLLRTMPRELPWLRCRHIDLSADSADANAARVLTELQTASNEPEIAWREHRRLVPLLEAIPLDREAAQPLPFQRGGLYLVTGGFGGIGAHVTRYLRDEFDAKLVIIGRASLAERADALAALGDAIYERADLSELETMRAAIDRAETRWTRKLDGVIHLAGVARDCALIDETRDGIRETFDSKVRGTIVLQQLLAARPDAIFISFSSANALFGGAGFGTYAAANRFLESAAHERRRSGAARTWCLAWSAWDGVGMNHESCGRELAEAQGYQWLSSAQALHSLAAMLCRREPLAWIGLDDGNPRLHPSFIQSPQNRQRLTAWTVVNGAAPRGLELTDRFGVGTPCEISCVPRLPRTAGGEIDWARLQGAKSGCASVAPRTEVERRLGALWQEVLGTPSQSVHESFFQAGGHSLLAAQLVARVSEMFQIELRLPALFEAPTIAGLAARVERFVAESGAVAPTRLTRVLRDDDPPLSFAQERLWFLDQLKRQQAVYNVPIALRLRGILDVAALRGAFDEIVRRHEALRTTFTLKNGQPVQVIATLLAGSLEIENLQHEEDREGTALKLATEEARKPFDLTAGPLFRTRLLRLDKSHHILLLTLHHIVSDGWSYGVLARELSALYSASVTGTSPALPELPIQYADYAHWQRELLKNEGLGNQLDYWREQLAGAPPVLELPTDWQRPAIETSSGAWLPLRIPAQLTEALEELSRREGVTLFMTLLAAFQTLLHRYTDETDIVVGSPIAGRSRQETEPLIGFFANTLVLRNDLAGDPTFREMLQRVRDVATGAYANQDLPFEKLVEALNPVRDLARHPIFQIMFALQNTPLETPALPGVAAEWMQVDPGTAMFDLNFFLERSGDGMKGLIEYNTDLFAKTTMARLAGHFITLLEGIVRNPDEHLSRLPLLTEPERRQLLIEWNDTEFEHPPIAALHQLIEIQCTRTPDATALVFEGKRWSYADLNRAANRWAHRLRKHGVGPDVIVGICAERSFGLVAGLLGILKAGGAYLPLDPSYPRERVAFMLADARPPIVLVEQRLAASLPATEARVLHLDSLNDDHANDEDLACENTPDHLAYVIYTSGSTGQPKGVMNTHRGICNRLRWMQRAYELSASDAVMQKTPFSFDVSVWEFFWPLLAGARLVLARPDGHRDAAYLIELIRSERITTMHFVPSMLGAFLDVPDVERCTSLRRVICSGEELIGELQERFFARSQAELHNLYGPTEAAVDVSFWACRRGDARRSVPIGRPIDNTQLYVLDSQLQLAPIGIAGELHIGGVGLARGYLNRPELTAERFIADPFSTAPGARLYKTGDIARFLSNGAIEFLGRRDHQVKMRGFRIELGEIEAALLAQPGVRQAVVVARERTPGDLQLTAFLAVQAGQVLEPALLRDGLRRTLPDYMVPAHFVALEELPLTPSGKVDRGALPAGPDDAALSPAPAATSEPVEGHLQRLWTELLGAREITPRDNFFDLGGHSLLAIRMFAEIERRLGVRLSVSTLFRAPTIEQLAIAIRNQPPDSQRPSGLIALQSHGTRRPIFWIPSASASQNAWEGIGAADYVDLAKSLTQDQPSYSFAPAEKIEDPCRLAKYCLKLMREVQPQGPYILAAYCLGGEVAYEMLRRLQRAGQEIEAFIIFEGYSPANRYSMSAVPGDSQRSRTCRRIANVLHTAPSATFLRIRRRLEILRHQAALKTYRRKPFEGRALLFRSDEELGAHPLDLGWNDLIRPAPEVIMVPAGHHSMLRNPVARLVATELLRRLDSHPTG